MRKIVLYSAVTIDGLIARPDGRVDWLDAYGTDPGGSDYGDADFIAGIDTTIMGSETYRVTKKLGGIKAMANYENYVLTRKKDRTAEKHVTFLTDDIPAFVGALKKRSGGNIWLLGGGQANTLLLDAGLIDEMILTVVPVVLGEGIPLFAQPGKGSTFSLRGSKTFANGLVQSIHQRSDR